MITNKAFQQCCVPLKPWINDPIFGPKFHATFDVMFDDISCRDGQIIQYFTKHLNAIEILDEM